MRFTVRRSRRAYVLPATHFASRYTDLDLLRMGERLRLRKDFDTSGFPPHARAILEGLKKYGMFVADNGQDWLMSISPDARLQRLETLERVKGSGFRSGRYRRPEQFGATALTLTFMAAAGGTRRGLGGCGDRLF